MTEPLLIRFFLSALLSITGCMISVAAAESDCPSKCDQSDCQACPPCPLPPLGEASISINRGKIQVYCAKGDSTSECADALSDVIISEGGGSTTVVYATNSIKCGNTVYEVSTGTKGGGCDTVGPIDGQTESTKCADGQNKASASCKQGCGTTSGSGSCTIKIFSKNE